LTFLDETSGVTQKAQNPSRTPKSSSSSPPKFNPGSSDILIPSELGEATSSLSPNLEIQATTFFFENFAIDEEISVQYQLYASTINETSSGLAALKYSIRAVGLAGLSRFTATPSLAALADRQYLVAIRAMNKALQDSETAKEDHTLLAVMILTIFETMANTDTQSTFNAWSNHVRGAAALLAARGSDQLKSTEGLRLFFQAALPCIASCIGQGVPLDEPIRGLSKLAIQQADSTDPAWLFFEHKVLFADFFGNVKQKFLTDPRSIIDRALILEETAIRIGAEAGDNWTYDVLETDSVGDLVLLNRYHVYKYFLCAETWNATRATRILLNQMIRSILLIGFATRHPVFTEPSYTTLFQRATETLEVLQNEVITTVPQYLGYPIQPSSARASPSGSSAKTNVKTPQFLWSNFPNKRYMLPTPKASETAAAPSDHLTPTQYSPSDAPPSHPPLPMIRTGGGTVLPWSLFLIGTTDITTPETRAWCVSRLEQIANDMGVRQAGLFAAKLDDESEDGYRAMEGWWRGVERGLVVISTMGTEQGKETGSMEVE
jgi:Fungal specific transcription factor domain